MAGTGDECDWVARWHQGGQDPVVCQSRHHTRPLHDSGSYQAHIRCGLSGLCFATPTFLSKQRFTHGAFDVLIGIVGASGFAGLGFTAVIPLPQQNDAGPCGCCFAFEIPGRTDERASAGLSSAGFVAIGLMRGCSDDKPAKTALAQSGRWFSLLVIGKSWQKLRAHRADD